MFHFKNPWSLLRKKCPIWELFWSAFSRIWTENGEILRIQSECGKCEKNADQNNAEYGLFLHSGLLQC